MQLQIIRYGLSGSQNITFDAVESLCSRIRPLFQLRNKVNARIDRVDYQQAAWLTVTL